MEENLLKLIDNLFLYENNSKNIQLEIFSVREKNYDELNKGRNGKPKTGPLETVTPEMICKSVSKKFNNIFNSVSVYFVNQYLINSRDNRLVSFIKKYSHDRFFISNYRYNFSGRSADYNPKYDLIKKEYKNFFYTNLFSHGIVEKDSFEAASERFKIIEDLKKFIPDHEEWFDTHSVKK